MSRASVPSLGSRLVSPGITNSAEVAIVVVNYNGQADTMRCLGSLHELDHDRTLTVVIDNGSTTDATAAIAEEHPWAAVIRRDENGGWAGGNNEGIRYALEQGVSYVILLNNDTTVAPNLVCRLLEAARRRPDCGILGPVICFMDEPATVMTDGCTFNGVDQPGFFQRRPIPLTRADSEPAAPEVTEVDIVNGCCMMIAAAVFERIGLIDERFFLIHEESDFCLRAEAAGFRCGLIGEALVWHKGSSSFKRSGDGLQRYFDTRNLFLLLRKHAATRRSGRGRFASWWEYLKYVAYRYTIEREQGEDQAADAVVTGLSDALAGRYGPRTSGRRRSAPILRRLLDFGRNARRRLRPSHG